MKSVAIYARVSTKRQAEEATIDSQTEALMARASEDGHVVLPDDLFLDRGYSGSTLRRPELDRLRDRLAQGDIDVVYLHSADRLARRSTPGRTSPRVSTPDSMRPQGGSWPAPTPSRSTRRTSR